MQLWLSGTTEGWWTLRYRPDCEEYKWEAVSRQEYAAGQFAHYGVASFAEYADARACVLLFNDMWSKVRALGAMPPAVGTKDALIEEGRNKWGEEA